MDNSVEYQKLYGQILDIRNSHLKMGEKNQKLLSLLRSTILIDDKTFKESDINLLVQDEMKFIDEIDNIILPIIKQKIM